MKGVVHGVIGAGLFVAVMGGMYMAGPVDAQSGNRLYVLAKAIPAGNPENPGGFVIPAGQACKVNKRVGADMVQVQCPEGYSELGVVFDVQGTINASDLK